MQVFKFFMVRLLCTVMIGAWAQMTLAQEATLFDPDMFELQAGDLRFWSGSYGAASANGDFGFINVNGVTQLYVGFWIAKEGGETFDVSRFQVTTLTPWEGFYHVYGYRNGVEVFHQTFGLEEYLYNIEPGTQLSFDTDIKNIDTFFIRAGIATDGYHSRVDRVEGIDHNFMQRGANTSWVYADQNIQFGVPDSTKIGPLSTVTPILEEGYIGAVKVTFPVTADVEGEYAGTFMLRGYADQGRLLGNYAWSAYLTPGVHTVTLQLDAADLITTDGPYDVGAVIMHTPAGVEVATLLPSNKPISRWQFYPRNGLYNIEGYLGAVPGPEDVNILSLYRNQPALVPGDRRDLNRDGKIDLKDIMLLQKMVK